MVYWINEVLAHQLFIKKKKKKGRKMQEETKMPELYQPPQISAYKNIYLCRKISNPGLSSSKSGSSLLCVESWLDCENF